MHKSCNVGIIYHECGKKYMKITNKKAYTVLFLCSCKYLNQGNNHYCMF